jgi:hypothetical protein
MHLRFGVAATDLVALCPVGRDRHRDTIAYQEWRLAPERAIPHWPGRPWAGRGQALAPWRDARCDVVRMPSTPGRLWRMMIGTHGRLDLDPSLPLPTVCADDRSRWLS